MSKGLFVAIEGGDGLGKSTLINNLKNKFSDAVFTFEPGGTEFGGKVRELIMQSDNISFEAEMYLFCASRAEFIRKIVKPNLDNGKMVVTDRFVYSSLVYQGIVGKLGVENVYKSNEMALDGIVPDIVLCLYGEQSFRHEILNRFDNQNENQSKTINKAFVDLAKVFDNFKVIDVTNLTEREVFECACKLIIEAQNKKENNG